MPLRKNIYSTAEKTKVYSEKINTNRILKKQTTTLDLNQYNIFITVTHNLRDHVHLPGEKEHR